MNGINEDGPVRGRVLRARVFLGTLREKRGGCSCNHDVCNGVILADGLVASVGHRRTWCCHRDISPRTRIINTKTAKTSKTATRSCTIAHGQLECSCSRLSTCEIIKTVAADCEHVGGGTILARVYVTHGRACIPGCIRHHVREEQDETRGTNGEVAHWPVCLGWHT